MLHHFIRLLYLLLLMNRFDEDEIDQEREGPIIRFVVQNDVLIAFSFQLQIMIDGQSIGGSGLCIQSMLSSCIDSLTYFERVLKDSFLVFFISLTIIISVAIIVFISHRFNKLVQVVVVSQFMIS